MAQFNFTTNIEKRTPLTGAVVCIDRMTSDYAEQHPFDVDGFIESVYQEFAGTEFEESRETLRGIWKAVLSVTSPRGDASLYPNKNGATRAAAMKVWHKAGDYWRRGLRIGDTLPDIEPMCKITRLDNGAWIALFPKDMHLLGEADDVPELPERPQQPVQPVSQPPNVVGAVAGEPPENEAGTATADIPAETATGRTRRRKKAADDYGRTVPTGIESPSEATGTATGEMPNVNDEATADRDTTGATASDTEGEAVRNLAALLSMMTRSKAVRELTKGAGILTALFVIWQTGLLIPFALLGGIAAGVVK